MTGPTPGGSPSTRASAENFTRRGLMTGAVLVLTGCSLRVEKDAPIPGPRPTTPSDVAPLTAIREHLALAGRLDRKARDHTSSTRALAHLRDRQLKHLDATLRGLETSAPTQSAARGGTTTWQQAETAWVREPLLPTLAQVSAVSRPMVLSAAASGLAVLEAAGTPVPYDPDAVLPRRGASDVLDAAAAAIDAFEWIVSHAAADKRGSTPETLSWLYAVRGMAQARVPAPSSNASASGTPAPIQRYANDDAAGKVAVTALQELLVACPQAARGAEKTTEVSGVLLTWSKTIRELDRHGAPSRSDFPGMSVGS